MPAMKNGKGRTDISIADMPPVLESRLSPGRIAQNVEPTPATPPKNPGDQVAPRVMIGCNIITDLFGKS